MLMCDIACEFEVKAFKIVWSRRVHLQSILLVWVGEGSRSVPETVIEYCIWRWCNIYVIIKLRVNWVLITHCARTDDLSIQHASAYVTAEPETISMPNASQDLQLTLAVLVEQVEIGEHMTS